MTREEFMQQEEEKLEFFTTQIVKVHGQNHPELAEVRRLFSLLNAKLAQNPAADLTKELKELKEVTHNYEVPSDACGAYRETYRLLKELSGLSFKEADSLVK